MKKNRLPLIAAAFAAMPFAGPAAAQSSSSAAYVGVDYAQLHYNNVCPPGAECNVRSNAGGLFAGLQFSRYIAIEAGWRDLGHATVSGANLKASAAEADVVVNLPIYRQLSLVGRAGAYHAMMKGDTGSGTKNGGTFGLGGQLDFTPSVATRLEWQRYAKLGGDAFSTKTDVDAVSLSVLFRFQ